jgi:hypothetical protein
MSSEKKSIGIVIPDSSSADGELERLRRDINRPDIEKLKLFTQMLRVDGLFKKAKVTHK